MVSWAAPLARYSCLNHRTNDHIACFICKYNSGVKKGHYYVILRSQLKIGIWKHTGVSRGWKRRVCFSGVLQGRKLESNLQEHNVSIKAQKVHHDLASIENSFTKWYNPEIKASTWSQILTKCYFLNMLRMINHLRPRNRRSSQHDLPNLDWQLFAAPLSRATLDDPNFLIRLLTLTMASSPPSEKQILGSIVTSLRVISRKRTLSLSM